MWQHGVHWHAGAEVAHRVQSCKADVFAKKGRDDFVVPTRAASVYAGVARATRPLASSKEEQAAHTLPVSTYDGHSENTIVTNDAASSKLNAIRLMSASGLAFVAFLA